MGCNTSRAAGGKDSKSSGGGGGGDSAAADPNKVYTSAQKKYTYAWPDGCNLAPYPLNAREIRKRIECTKPQTVMLGDVSVNFSCLSQRGYYPTSPDKQNQDAFDLQLNICENMNFFGVFDGHGPVGELCARFARDNVSKLLKEKLTKGAEPKIALMEAHVEADNKLDKSVVDDQQSGTTANSCLFIGSTFYVSNVGDSRTMLGTLEGGKLVGKSLSRDQTPYRKDERERVKKKGARVMTADQLDGIEPIHENWDVQLGDEIDDAGDPPRIWSPDGEYPGTAFTRSIGDRLASSLGVFAEPEIDEYTFAPNDKILVLASDGIFEFITTQHVIDISALYDNPSESCRALVGHSFKLWIEREDRTDDITCIVMFLGEEKVESSDIAIGGVEGEGEGEGEAGEGGKKHTRRGSLNS